MSEAAIIPIETLTLNDLRPLLDESLSEGYGFMQTFWDEYETGKNRFDSEGAILMGVYEGDRLIGIGGVQRDPYLNRVEVGRLRHIYVLNVYRRTGIGKRLLGALVEHARAHFDLLTLRTQTEAAAAFYRAVGFEEAADVPEATHFLRLKPAKDGQLRGE